MTHFVLIVVFGLLMLPGIIGVFLPLLPGIPFMLIVALIFGFVDHFGHLAIWELLILLALALASLLIDYLSGVIGARMSGASAKSSLGGIIGLIIGLILFPPFGGIVGLFAGILITELLIHNDNKRAVKAATGGLIGAIVGILTNLFVALAFLGLFIFFAWR